MSTSQPDDASLVSVTLVDTTDNTVYPTEQADNTQESFLEKVIECYKKFCPSPDNSTNAIIAVSALAGTAGAAYFDYETPQLAASWVLWASAIILLFSQMFAEVTQVRWIPGKTQPTLYLATILTLLLSICLIWLGPMGNSASDFMSVVVALSALGLGVFAVSYGQRYNRSYDEMEYIENE